MKNLFALVVFAVLAMTGFAQEGDTLTELQKFLATTKGISDVEQLNGTVFAEKYVFFIEQNVDKDNPQAGKFKQRVIVGLKGINRPTVIVTEGYAADYATRPNYREELSELMNANLVFVEHRYFSQSVPEPCNWQYMTIANSCEDLHNIRQTMGKIFKSTWVSTGISKGGSTCTYYRAAYPDDVDASVAYVAPISRGMEDGRHEKFLNKKVGTKEDRKAIHEVMAEFMARKPKLVNMLDTFCANRNLKFFLPINEIFDYEVLEFEFSLWQWGTPISTAPKKYESDVKWFNYLVQMVGPEYFAYPSQHLPFYYQAIHELGYYGYCTKYLGKNASVKDTKGYLKKIMADPSWRNLEFDPTFYQKTCDFLKKNDPTHIFIYGQNDPWTASGVAGWLNCKKKSNMKVYVQPGGSHLARIANQPSANKEEIIAKLKAWMKY